MLLYFTHFILVSSWHITGYNCKFTRQMLTTVHNITLRNKHLNNYVKQWRETNKGSSHWNLVFKWKWDQRKVDTSCHISQWVLFSEIDSKFSIGITVMKTVLFVTKVQQPRGLHCQFLMQRSQVQSRVCWVLFCFALSSI